MDQGELTRQIAFQAGYMKMSLLLNFLEVGIDEREISSWGRSRKSISTYSRSVSSNRVKRTFSKRRGQFPENVDKGCLSGAALR